MSAHADPADIVDQSRATHPRHVGGRHAGRTSRLPGNGRDAARVPDHVRRLQVAEIGDRAQGLIDLLAAEPDRFARFDVQNVLGQVPVAATIQEVLRVFGDHGCELRVVLFARPNAHALADVLRPAADAVLADLIGDVDDPHRQGDGFAMSESLGADAVPALVDVGQPLYDARPEPQPLGDQLRRLAVMAVMVRHVLRGERLEDAEGRGLGFGLGQVGAEAPDELPGARR